MFKRTGPNEAVSEEGFRIRRVSRDQLYYEDSDGIVELEVEPGEPLAVYFPKSLVRKVGAESRDVDTAKASVIRRRIEEGLRYLGIRHIIAKG